MWRTFRGDLPPRAADCRSLTAGPTPTPGPFAFVPGATAAPTEAPEANVTNAPTDTTVTSAPVPETPAPTPSPTQKPTPGTTVAPTTAPTNVPGNLFGTLLILAGIAVVIASVILFLVFGLGLGRSADDSSSKSSDDKRQLRGSDPDLF